MPPKSDRTIRADLKPYWRAGKWYARGWVPERQPDGSIARRRVERSAKTTRKQEAWEFCRRLSEHYEGRALAIRRPLTFARAVTNYITSGGDARFLTKELLLRIGTMQCTDIDESTVVDCATALYPNATAATLNRQIYTPIIAVLRQAARSGACPRPDFKRPTGHDAIREVKVPDLAWFRAVLPLLSPPRRAALLFMTLHGRRTKDALTRTPADYNPERGTLTIGKSKEGHPIMIELAEPVMRAIESYDWKKGPWLFQCPYTSRRTFARAIESACKKAKQPYFAPHAIGRHSFATRMLELGYSTKHVARMGGWADEKMVSRRYGYLAHDEMNGTVRTVGKKWGNSFLGGPKQDAKKFKKVRKFRKKTGIIGT